MLFGIRVVPATEAEYAEIAKGQTVRSIAYDGEIRLYHPNRYESLLLIEDEIVISAERGLLAAKQETKVGYSYYVVKA